jgi:hypothetical protein
LILAYRGELRHAEAASARGECAIGYRLDGDAEFVMNPPKSRLVRLTTADRVAVIGPPE